MISPVASSPVYTPSYTPTVAATAAPVSNRANSEDTLAISPCAQLAADMKAAEINFGKV